ncbi:hypothetical protein L6164_006448 [Bauhinia variegata]|uniref:Uncharacterized protein n=1 Tax=Bauhinia variegata TaxID=167791 RepID=A0ACB9PV06_BAUVA|nr:hypothetical protein L6164_006448 [Bauhinia variegata]
MLAEINCSRTSVNSSMAEEHYHKQSHDLWQVLVLGSTTFSAMLEAQYSHKFHFISASASPLPLHQFLTAHHYEPSSFPALLSLGAYPDVTADILQLLPSLSLIVTNSTGIDHIDLLECRRRGVQVANAGTVFSEDVADVAVGLLIDVTRKLSAADRYMRTTLRPAGSWYFPLGSKLGAKRVGLVGLGSIGRKLQRGLRPLVASYYTTLGIKSLWFHTPFTPVFWTLQLQAMHLLFAVH